MLPDREGLIAMTAADEEKRYHMVRPPKLTPHQRQEAIERRERGDTLMDIACIWGIRQLYHLGLHKSFHGH
jgi:hypothetical protein